MGDTMTNSTLIQGSRVTFPAFTSERVYMRKFWRSEGLPPDLRRWQATVDAMLDGVESNGPVYFMVDQLFVRAGQFHRRPGVHVDYYWHDGLSAHGPIAPPSHHSIPSTPGHRRVPPGHSAIPSLPGHRRMPPGHHPSPGHRITPGHASAGANEAIVLASDLLGCRAYVGQYEGVPLEGGDAAHIDVSRLDRVDMEPGRVWVADAGATLHETIPQAIDYARSVVRLNVTGWAT